jgi:hypothetical protein
MKAIRGIIGILLILLAVKAFAQRGCGSYSPPPEYFHKNPGLLDIIDEFDLVTNHYMSAARSATQPGILKGVITIPVYVHVIYNIDRKQQEDVADSVVLKQIAKLNEDFAGKNTDIAKTPGWFQPNRAGDCQIVFQRPQIKHDFTHREIFNVPDVYDPPNDSIKHTKLGGADAVSPKHVLNIWIGNISGYGAGDGLLGYGNFPLRYTTDVDGVVIDYTVCMDWGHREAYDGGRTLTHEVGHWLNLYHLWGPDSNSRCDNDFIDDTPLQIGSNGGCPHGRVDDCLHTPTGCMYMNYMDYVDDTGMVMFTKDQRTRMRACFALGGGRADFLTANFNLNRAVLSSININKANSLQFTDVSLTDADKEIEWGKVKGAQSYTLVVNDLTNKEKSPTMYQISKTKTNIFDFLDKGKIYEIELKAKIKGIDTLSKGTSILVTK